MFSIKSKLNSYRWSSGTNDVYDIRKYQATDIANELTLINQNLLLRIKPEELFNFVFLSSEKKMLAPNLTSMVEFYNRTVLLFATQILQQKTDKMRVTVGCESKCKSLTLISTPAKTLSMRQAWK
ncbi:unnamed protein product [Adineta steineri]|uniref:Ras-GEF domain-containing protein n=1 Tax=Adineta steineri TaxID=433720 RepID=A0A815T997_9BILA|nr:unnamed protein product [Adineta steineri]